MGEGSGSMSFIDQQDGFEWTRASEAFPNATLFGAEGVNPEDLSQNFM